MSSATPKNNNASDQQPNTGSPSRDGTSYPEQRHAGRVGYGPNYHTGPTLEEKVAGLKEEFIGKVTRSPARVQHGRELLSGEERRKKLSVDDEPNPFIAANKDDHETDYPGRSSGPSVGVSSSTVPSNSTAPAVNSDSPGPDQNPQLHSGYPPKPNPSGMVGNQGYDKSAKEQAATVAPQGTHDAHVQRQGEAVDRVKYI